MSVSGLKSEVGKINTKLNVKKTAFGWLDPRDGLVHTSQRPWEDEILTAEEWKKG